MRIQLKIHSISADGRRLVARDYCAPANSIYGMHRWRHSMDIQHFNVNYTFDSNELFTGIY